LSFNDQNRHSYAALLAQANDTGATRDFRDVAAMVMVKPAALAQPHGRLNASKTISHHCVPDCAMPSQQQIERLIREFVTLCPD
jgi:hypothetical protein